VLCVSRKKHIGSSRFGKSCFRATRKPARQSWKPESGVTVNKSQGQTIPNVGVYLPEPVFSHDQLYVALSRATARSNIRILAVPAAEKDVNKGKEKGDGKKKATKDIFIKNIIYKVVITP